MSSAIGRSPDIGRGTGTGTGTGITGLGGGGAERTGGGVGVERGAEGFGEANDPPRTRPPVLLPLLEGLWAAEGLGLD